MIYVLEKEQQIC